MEDDDRELDRKLVEAFEHAMEKIYFDVQKQHNQEQKKFLLTLICFWTIAIAGTACIALAVS